MRNDGEDQEEKRVMDFGLQIKLTLLAIAALVWTIIIVVAIMAYGQEEIASVTEVTKIYEDGSGYLLASHAFRMSLQFCY